MTRKSAHKGSNEEGSEELINDDQQAGLEKNLAVMALDNLPRSDGVPPSLAVGPSRPPKRPRSPEISKKKQIDIASARQLCIDGKIYELIDISNDEVPFS